MLPRVAFRGAELVRLLHEFVGDALLETRGTRSGGR